jgi:proline dehydrogenase
VALLRSALLAASHSSRLRRGVERFSPTKAVVERFVGGSSVDEVVKVAANLRVSGLLTTIDHLGEDVTDARGANATVEAYLELLGSLDGTTDEDVSVKLTALGLSQDRDGALERARTIVRAATKRNVTVTIDMESSALTDVTLEIVRELRREVPSVAAVIQAMLRRSELDAAELGAEGARVRLCKGAYAEESSVAFHGREPVRASYLRCLHALWESPGTALVATHDPEMVSAATELAANSPRSFEFQMLYGVRSEEQVRLARAGHRVRVYVPYGDEWYGYLVRRLAERPANLGFFLRSLSSKS